ncbi:hypothetical protein VT47_00460 [Pseudomonas syringae pv. syringae]|nr:hypothetical protein VT47_00460 [Pseudomonas syringae pv. syringae]
MLIYINNTFDEAYTMSQRRYSDSTYDPVAIHISQVVGAGITQRLYVFKIFFIRRIITNVARPQ